jgi:hypothetical protein
MTGTTPTPRLRSVAGHAEVETTRSAVGCRVRCLGARVYRQLEPHQQDGVNMSIGVGTLVLIVAVVLVVMMMRGRSSV